MVLITLAMGAAAGDGCGNVPGTAGARRPRYEGHSATAARRLIT